MGVGAALPLQLAQALTRSPDEAGGVTPTRLPHRALFFAGAPSAQHALYKPSQRKTVPARTQPLLVLQPAQSDGERPAAFYPEPSHFSCCSNCGGCCCRNGAPRACARVGSAAATADIRQHNYFSPAGPQQGSQLTADLIKLAGVG